MARDGHDLVDRFPAPLTELRYPMRSESWFFVAAWTLMMAVMCGFGFLLIGMGGWGAVTPGLLFAAFAGGCALWGWHALRASTRPTEDHPEVLSVPEPVDHVLTIRKTSLLGLIPVLLFSAVGWGGLALCVVSTFGLVDGEGSVVAGMVICGLFVVCGHCVLMEHAVIVSLDLRHRRWEVRKGVWPIRSSEHGDLIEASQVAVAREVRSDEGAEYEVLVARLEWQDGWHAPLVLGERPNNSDALRYGGDTHKMDYRRAMTRWASGLAGVLDLPLTEEAKKAPAAEC
jgi:hypothetical protein